MNTFLKSAVALCAVIVLGACQQQNSGETTVAELQLETPNQRLSYGVALGLGRNMANDGMTVDVDAFAAGLRDAMTNSPQRLTDEEIQAEMIAFQERVNAERESMTSAMAEANAAAATAFLLENSTREGVVTTESGLQYEVIEAGDGAMPTAEDSVEVHYRGTLIDGTEFDSSYARGEPVTFGVGQVISGWTEALQLMQVGSKYKLFIPSELAYGAGGAGERIGPNAALVFEVELLSIPTQAGAEG
ncbi:FKBP-type peptidyl-prolyl cis-trans isomerase [Congregibacter brevis]|uniref:Peptidyl-prolyl cis-trans isomerase n=1 Tax=Congregibacter brevis TaxID=3081201 RepID=A0ABZ0IFM2_9GAMM|nr:FKBP-type peptidyl-prolyl cis-trans isomerase [Congregibacter sp. IMCC45268]